MTEHEATFDPNHISEVEGQIDQALDAFQSATCSNILCDVKAGEAEAGVMWHGIPLCHYHASHLDIRRVKKHG